MTPLLWFLLGGYAVGALWTYISATDNLGFDWRGPHRNLVLVSLAFALFWPVCTIAALVEELWHWAKQRMGK